MTSPCDSESSLSRFMPQSKRRRRSDSFEQAVDFVQRDVLVESNRPRKARKFFNHSLKFHIIPGPNLNPSYVAAASNSSMAGLDQPTTTSSMVPQERSSDWWLETGDLVLGVESLILRIHKSVLSESIVFQDMFELSQPGSSSDDVDNLPLVQLHDSAADWMEALQWLYNGSPSYDVFNMSFIPFSTLKAHLTISNKYEITTLRTLSQQALETLYPASLSRLFSLSPTIQSTALLNAAEAINLARLCDIPSVLPAAFYYLSTAKWRYDEDGGRAHASLSPLDVRRLIVGREALLDASIRLATTLSVPFGLLPPVVQELVRENGDHGPNAPPIQSSFCSASCLDMVLREWSSALFSPGTAYKSISLLKTLKDLAEANTPQGLCMHCTMIRSVWLEKQTQLVIRSLPGWFGL